MKKASILASVSVFLCSLLVITIVCLITPKEREIVLTSADKLVTVNLGEYDIKNYTSGTTDGENKYILFDVDSNEDFFNGVIKKSEYYFADLEMDVERYFAYGYLFKDNCFFKYIIQNQNVKIESSQGLYREDEDAYYLNVPVAACLCYEYLTSADYDYYQRLEDENITVSQLYRMVSYLPTEAYCIQDNIIYMKGIADSKLSSNEEKWSDDYIIKLYEKDDKIRIAKA